MHELIQNYDEYLPDIDIADGVRRVMNKEKIYLMLAGKFKPSEMGNDIISKIESGAGSDAIRDAAHALKGSAANLSMPVISNAALLIEEDAKAGGDGAEHIPALKEAMESLDKKIKLLLG